MNALLRIFLLAAAATMLAAPEVCAATGDWPQYGFTAAGRRENTQETMLTRKTVPHLVRKWSAQIEINDSSAPAVANGIVYVGSGDSRLYAFDAETGAVRWATLTGDNGVESPVTVAKGLVYAGSGHGDIFAIGAKTGIVKWAVTAVRAAPISAPVVADGIAYFANAAGELSAFDAKTGASLWSQEFSFFGFASAPATYKGSVFVSDGWYLYAFDAKTGQTRWASQDGDARASGIGMAGGHIYVEDSSGLLETYDAATGQLKWTDTGQPMLASAPALANDVIYIGGKNGNQSALSAYDTRTSKRLWQDQSTSEFGTPTVANGMVYVSNGNTFSAYGLP